VRAEFHRWGREVVPFGIADRPHGGLAPLTVHAVDEQHAVEVIGLVLQAAGQVAGADHLDRIAVGGIALRDHVHPALGVVAGRIRRSTGWLSGG
jgi:hypothetical protein